jgi:hypothetical protein
MRQRIVAASNAAPSFKFIVESPSLVAERRTRCDGAAVTIGAFEAFADLFTTFDAAQSLVTAVDMTALNSALIEHQLVAPHSIEQCYADGVPNPNCCAYLARDFDVTNPEWMERTMVYEIIRDLQLFYEVTKRADVSVRIVAEAMHRAILVDDRAFARYIGEHFPEVIDNDMRNVARTLHRSVILEDMPE